MKDVKRKIQFVLFVAMLFAFQSYSCVGGRDYGPVEKETRNVSDFEAIEVSDGIDVYLTMGSREYVEVETSDKLLEHLVTEVRGGTLKIYFDKSFNWNKEAKVYVEAKRIESISTSGGSDLTGENTIESKDLVLNASGGSDIRLDIETRNLNVEVSGGADVLISGVTDYIHVNTSGGSDLKAFDLIAQRADCDASGGSDIKVNVEDELDARASGGADIIYMGNPRRINSDASSSSDITKRN